MKRHANLSIFVPHAGCLHRCSFCDQRTISGAVGSLPDANTVSELCEKALPAAGNGQNTEIAFFGGSFTALPHEYMESLLSAAAVFVEQGRASGIRISTRPDAIDPTVLKTLAHYHVTSVELGAQSMSDRVLQLNGRGHTRLQLEFAAKQVKNAGFSLGLQMMLGLYGETDPVRSARDTALALAALSPNTVRIYPALVLMGTELERLYRAGVYRPLSVEQAVEAVSPLLELFEAKQIRVIRVGLHDEPGLSARVVAGPYHPAFRQLCDAALFLEGQKKLLQGLPPGEYTVQVAKGQRSAAAGQKNKNLAFWQAAGYRLQLLENGELSGRQMRLVCQNG